jgi:hypothetical protein
MKERNSAYKPLGPFFFHVWHMIYFQAQSSILIMMLVWLCQTGNIVLPLICDLAYVFDLLTVSYITIFAGT